MGLTLTQTIKNERGEPEGPGGGVSTIPKSGTLGERIYWKIGEKVQAC